jgi:hypothetical protein
MVRKKKTREHTTKSYPIQQSPGMNCPKNSPVKPFGLDTLARSIEDKHRVYDMEISEVYITGVASLATKLIIFSVTTPIDQICT